MIKTVLPGAPAGERPQRWTHNRYKRPAALEMPALEPILGQFGGLGKTLTGAWGRSIID
jgi:hypothetical protein